MLIKIKFFNWHYATLVFDYIINSLIDLPEGEKDQFIVNLELYLIGYLMRVQN